MRRRQLLLTGPAAIAWMAVRPALPQQATGGRPRRIGGLSNLAPSDPAAKRTWTAFLEGLREYGWVEGQNLLIEGRWVEGHTERYGPYAAELVSRGDIEVIVAVGTQATRETKTRTTTIPIVMVYVNDPVGAGLVASLARPGGNITGIAGQFNEMQEKTVELLRELVPDLHRVFVLWQPDSPGSQQGFEELNKLATRLGLTLSSAPLATDGDLEPALASIAADLPQGLVVHAIPVAFRRRREIAAFAAAQHLPTVAFASELARTGLLLSYGPDIAPMYRRAGFYVDRLLRGAKAAELPVEQPTKFELVINLKTAKAIGLTIPESFLLRADEVIE
jgi:putative ABC transport system substrate-binding protein